MKHEKIDWVKWMEELQVCPLFDGMTQKEILSFLDEVKPRLTYFKKGQQMFKAGQQVTAFGIFLNAEPGIEPKKCIEKWRSPNYFRPGWVFAELPAFSDIDRMPRDVFSEENCFVMFIEAEAFTGYSGSFRIYRTLQRNMLGILARKCRVLKRSRAFFELKEMSEGLYDCLLRDKKTKGQDTFFESLSIEELAQILMCSEQELKQAYDELEKKQLIVRTSSGAVRLKEKAGIPVDFLYMARMNLKATTNIENQYYDISDEYIKLGSTSSEDGEHIGKYKVIVDEIAGIIVDKISEKLSEIEVTKPIGTALSWAWSAASLGGTIAECFSVDENDFIKNQFYRQWKTNGESDFAQYWEVSIEVPPGKTVEFQFSYDIWSSSNEKLEGTPITCRISAPANLTSANNYKGVTYFV